jgi:two-component system, chemotaxis family, chemotaxis protein CheY
VALKLLVVDDELEVLKGIKSLTESLGYEVLALADSREAAERVNRQKFDGVFVDAQMPNLDGPGLVRVIRNSPSNSSVPIFMLTAYEDLRTMREGFRAGISFLMLKPIDPAQLGRLLRLMQGAMLREKRSYVRLPLRTLVQCRIGQRQYKSVSLDIGEGGMLLEFPGELEKGLEVELRFSLPEIPNLLFPVAKVTRMEFPGRVAVQFSEMSAEDRKALQNFIVGLVKE